MQLPPALFVQHSGPALIGQLFVPVPSQQRNPVHLPEEVNITIPPLTMVCSSADSLEITDLFKLNFFNGFFVHNKK